MKKQTSVGSHVAELASRLGKAGGIKLDAPPPVKRERMYQMSYYVLDGYPVSLWFPIMH